jgi:hypothetical protein
MTRDARIMLPAFFATVLAVLAVSILIVRSQAFADEPDALAWGITFDLALLVPAIYLIIARRMGWLWTPAIPLFLLGLLAAKLILPGAHETPVRALEFAAFPLELFVIVFVVIKVRQVRSRYREAATQQDDFVDTMGRVVSGLIPHERVASMLLTELSVFHYGLLGWRRPPAVAAMGDGVAAADMPSVFSYHRDTGYGGLVGVFFFLIVVEAGLLHMVLLPRVPVLAWILLIASIYGLLFILADYNAARHRPIRIVNGMLRLRVGLRWSVDIALSDVERVERASVLDREPEATANTDGGDREAGEEAALKAVLIGDPNVVVTTRRPYTASGLYGIRREFRRIAIAVDDTGGFIERLQPPA